MTSSAPQSAWGKQPSIAAAANQPITQSTTPAPTPVPTQTTNQSTNQTATQNKSNDLNGKKKQHTQPSPRAHNQSNNQSNKQHNQPPNQKPKSSQPSPSNAAKQPPTPSNNQANNQSNAQPKEKVSHQPKEHSKDQPKDQPKEQSKDHSKDIKEPTAIPSTSQSPAVQTPVQSTVPQTAPPSNQFVPSPQSELTQLLQIGNTVKLVTSTGVVSTGDVFVYDQETQALALEVIKPATNQTNNQETYDWSLHNARSIKVTLVKKADSSIHRSLPRVDQPRLIAKEAKAIAERQAQAAKIGHGVSSEGQRLFDVLAKLFPARWEDTIIVLMDALRLKAPYDSKSLSGGSAQQRQRIVKIIEAERAKMGLQ